MKTNKRIIILSTIVLLSTFIQSCYKMKDKHITIYGNVCCVDTNNVAVSGVKFRVYEKEFYNSNPKTFLVGETDQNGTAYYEFSPPKNSKWKYYLEIEQNSLPDYHTLATKVGRNYMSLYFSIDDEDEPAVFDVNNTSTYGQNDLIIVLTPK